MHKEEFGRELLTEREAASRLRCSRMSLFRWRRSGSLGHFRLGARVYYSPEHLTAFLSRSERKAA
jgi:excisionase family DNA binding protein